MSDYVYSPESGELYHYGVIGMKWGVRRARKYQSKAVGSMESSQKSLSKAKKFNDKRRPKEKKVMSKAVEAAESAYRAQKHSEQSDRLRQKHERKFENQVAKNQKRIDKAKAKNESPEKIQKKVEKAKKFIDTHTELTKSMSSITKQTDEQQRRIHDFVKYMEERTYWNQKLQRGDYD